MRSGPLIIILVMTTFLLSLGFGLMFLINSNTQRYKKQLVDNHIIISDLFARDITPNLTFSYKDGVKSVIKKLITIPSINYAEVRDEFDKIVADYTKPNVEKEIIPKLIEDDFLFIGDILHLKKSIFQDEIYTGYLYYQINTDQLESQINELLWSIFITMLIALFLAFILSIVIQKIITKPILNLNNIIRKVGVDKNYEIKIKREGFGEISDLFASFSNMISEIHSYDLQSKKSNIKLKLYTKELEESNEDLQNFAYVASHDLQEPLRKIVTFSSRLTDIDNEKLDDKSKKFLEIITKSSVRMQNLISDLLTFSRIKSNEKTYKKYDLNRIIQEVIDDLQLLIKKTNTIIKVDRLPKIEADVIQIRQVFQNIISNSIKYAKKNVTPIIHIKLIKQNRKSVEIHCIDNGIGFKNEYADKIFTIFQRLHGKNEYDGTGLGLAIVRKIIQRHGGEISAVSELGVGSSFIIKLPLKHLKSNI